MSDEIIRTNACISEKYNLTKNIAKINKIISLYKIHILRKKVKALIEKHKKCFTIQSTLKDKNLSLIAYLAEQEKEYEVIYEDILNQNVAYIPKEDYQKKLLLKFYFVNAKNESIIDPKYNNEYNGNMFLNVINLKKIIEKEEENYEDFSTFLETYFTSKNLSKEIRQYFFNFSSNFRNINKKRTFTLKGGLKLKKIRNNIKLKNSLQSILKTRTKNRIPSGKRISFGKVTKLEYYKERL